MPVVSTNTIGMEGDSETLEQKKLLDFHGNIIYLCNI